MENCRKLKYRRITEFPEESVSMLMDIETKREMLVQLMGFEEMHRIKKIEDPKYIPTCSWTMDIARIAKEFAGLLEQLPDEIRQQYDLLCEQKELHTLAARYVIEGKMDKAKMVWQEAKDMLCCGGKGDCCG